MKKLLLLTLFSAIFLFARGQATIPDYTVTGKIVDSLHHTPLPYATIIVQDSLTRKNIKNTSSGADGTFLITGLPKAGYRLSVSSMGYRSSTVRCPLPAGNRQDLGLISLLAVNSSLKEVVITARKPMIEQSDDKIIFNAENDPSSKTSTAIDILRKTPFVSVDGDNNIQVNGQSSFKILLNGKETAMFARNVKDALLAFPGSLIVKVEVITNPSAKYDAEGVGGVINIITKKKIVGNNGTLSVWTSTQKQLSGTGQFNAKTGKFNLSAIGFLSRVNPIVSTSESVTTPLVPAVFSRRTLTGDRSNSSRSRYASLEISYDADSLTTISTYGYMNSTRNFADTRQEVLTEFNSGNVKSGLNQYSDSQGPLATFGADITHKGKRNAGEEFTAKIYAQVGTNDQLTNGDQLSQSGSRSTRNTSNSENKEYTLQSDYVQPFKNKSKLETGVKAIIRVAASNYVSLLNLNNASFMPDPSNTNNFHYDQQVFSAYTSYSFKLKKYDFRAGLRAENTNVDGSFSSSAQPVHQNYLNLVPNLLITRKWSKVITSVLGYTMRLQRPAITSLNPFVNNTDTLNISYGNPFLGAQTYHTISLQNRIFAGNTFAGLTLSFSRSSNAIAQYALFTPSTGVTATTSGNVGRETQMFLTGSVNTSLKTVNLFLNGVFRYNRIQNAADPGLIQDGLSGYLFTGASYKATSRFTASGTVGYSQFPYTVLGKGAYLAMYQANFNYVIFKDKLDVNINVNNFFADKSTNVLQTENSSFRTVNTVVTPRRNVFFGLNYKFGRLKESTQKAKVVKNDDLVN
jgi:hypothetical protein